MTTEPRPDTEEIRPFSAATRVYATAIVLGLLGVVFFAVTRWIDGNFGVITIDQMMLNLAGGAEGVNTGDTSLVDSFIAEGLLTPLLIVAGAVAVFAVAMRLTARFRRRTGKPRSPKGWRTLALTLSIALVVGTAPQLANQMSLTQTIAAQASTDSLSDVYRDPAAVTAPETKKNLVTIYLESMEPTFSDATLFGRNLLQPLDDVTGDGWQQIDSYAQGDGLGWTMAGIVAT